MDAAPVNKNNSYALHIFNSMEELSEYFARLLTDDINHSEGKFNLVLSGGSTPEFIFSYISENYKSADWEKVNFFWGDERCVPPESVDSNYRMAYDNLLRKISADEKNIFRIRGESDPSQEARRYSGLIHNLVPFLNGKPVFDLIMLGIGEDGHTASIFPDRMSLLTDMRIYAEAEHPLTRQKRITLTGPAIRNAKKIIFIAAGKSKSGVVSEILTGSREALRYPAYHIKSLSGKTIWLTDKYAAKLLL